MDLARDALPFMSDGERAKLGGEPVVLDGDRRLVGEGRERLEVADVVARRRRPGHRERADRRAATAKRGGEHRGPRRQAQEARHLVARPAAGPIERRLRAARRAECRLAVGADQHQQREVRGEQVSSRVDRRPEDLVEVRERSDRLGDRVQRVGRRCAGLDLGVPCLERSGEAIHARERPAGEDRGQDGDDHGHEDRVPREGQVRIERGVAQELEDPDEQRRQDDRQPADRARDHRISTVSRLARPPVRRRSRGRPANGSRRGRRGPPRRRRARPGAPPRAGRPTSADRGRARRARPSRAPTTVSSGRTKRRLCAAPPVSTPASARASAPSSAGRADASNTKRVPDARAISSPCPRRPNPVTSVAARMPWATRTSDASRLSRRIPSTAAARSSASVRPCRDPETRSPVPSGFVRMSVSPGPAPPLRSRWSGWAAPMTASPYLGSGSRIV